jgi:ABC-type transport system substrate-binding protein
MATSVSYAGSFAGARDRQPGGGRSAASPEPEPRRAAAEPALERSPGAPRLAGPPVSTTRRAVLGAASGAATLPALTACQVNPFQRTNVDQVLRTFLWVSFETLDPAQTSGSVEAEYVVHVFSGLMGLNEKLEVVPDLAEKYQVSADGKTYSFILRRNARFHDGREVRAADVKYSLERAADPATRSPVSLTYLGDVAGFAERAEGRAAEVAGVRVRDDLTLDITLVEPRVDFLARLTYPVSFVVDRSNVESGGARWWTRPNGTGPFRVREARPGESLVLARHDAYHGAKPALSEVHFFPVLPLEAYETGQIDVAVVDLADVDRVTEKSDPLSRELHVRTDLDVRYLGFNVTAKPFDDPKVRQAFNQALDRDKIANVTLKQTVLKAEGILPPGMPGRGDKTKGLDFDVSGARQLIAESSYREVKNFPEIVMAIAGARTGPPAEINAIAAMYRQNLGVELRIRQYDYTAFMETLSKSPDRLQMFSLGWVADYADPQNFLDVLFHSGSPENHCQYANPDVDRLLERARLERDHTTRMRLYQDAEALILRDAPWVPLWHTKRYVLVKPYVQGYVSPPVVLPWLRWVSLTANAPRPKATEPSTP